MENNFGPSIQAVNYVQMRAFGMAHEKAAREIQESGLEFVAKKEDSNYGDPSQYNEDKGWHGNFWPCQDVRSIKNA